jgi:uncharacterized OB-fold protein
MSVALEYPVPVQNADSKVYWDSAAGDELVLKRCTECGKHHFPPRQLCPHCWSEKLDWTKSCGEGVVYSFTVMHRAPIPVFSARVPYVVALVDLAEGPRMMANVIGDDALEVAVGDRVRVCYEARGERAKVPQFRRL